MRENSLSNSVPSVIIDVTNLESSRSTEYLSPATIQNRNCRRFSEVPQPTFNSNNNNVDNSRRHSVIDSLNNLVTHSKPHQTIQTYLSHQQWNHSLLETYINRCYYIGLSPFRIDFTSSTEIPTFRTYPLAKFLFILWNLLALLHDICQLRLLTLSYDQFKRHAKLVYVFLGYRTVLTYMQFRYFQLLWWKRYKFTNLLASFRRADCITVRPTWTSLFPTVILFTSTFFSFICVIGGFNQLTDFASWSPWNVLTRYRNDLWLTILGPSEPTFSNVTTEIPTNPIDDLMTTCVVGGLSGFIDFVTELFHFCSVDVFFLSTVTIWMLARELEVEHLPVNLFHRMHRQQKQVMLITREINEIVKLFLPPLTTCTVISITYLIHLLLQQRWYIAFYAGLKLSKILIAYVLALKITDKMKDFEFWFFGDEAQEVLGLTVKELQIKVLEFSGLPIGIGEGPFFVDVKFMASVSKTC